MSAKKALLHAIERLPPEQKKVITLKIWSELTFDEISRTLDLSLNTVASRYRYALDKLKEWVPVSLEQGLLRKVIRIMNENEQLERELKAFRPQEPSADFERRVEEALGESARLAVGQLPEPERRTRSSARAVGPW